MNWKYVKPLESSNLISEYEKIVGYSFCDSFKRCVASNNGGRPEKRAFDTNKHNGREIKSFLSFNRDDKETVWKILEWNKTELAQKYVPFGIDNFGNLICFDSENDTIVFVNHEDLTVENIAENFESFIKKLYD